MLKLDAMLLLLLLLLLLLHTRFVAGCCHLSD